jgi:hypothetical protein
MEFIRKAVQSMGSWIENQSLMAICDNLVTLASQKRTPCTAEVEY